MGDLARLILDGGRKWERKKREQERRRRESKQERRRKVWEQVRSRREQERSIFKQQWWSERLWMLEQLGMLEQQRWWLEAKRWEEERWEEERWGEERREEERREEERREERRRMWEEDKEMREEEKRAGRLFLLMILQWISFLKRQTCFIVSFSKRVPWAKKRMKSVSASMPWTIAPALLVLWSVVWMFYDLFIGYPVPRDETIDWHELELSTTAATPNGPRQQMINLAATPSAHLGPVFPGPERPLNEISIDPGLLNRDTQFTEIRSRKKAPGATMEADDLTAGKFSGLNHPMPLPVHQNHENTLAPPSEVSTNAGAGQDGSGNNRHNKPTKKWICCDKEWSEKDYKRHRRSRLHDDVTPYRCTVAGCDKKFSREDNWRRHVTGHERRRGGFILEEGG
ncbi:hypothetical protein L207DRAFT_511569 [Hyaloscypha variabilis F]|uniref:C2H2-type domain-containing protein n=1 Tax=Hyaloscypha variabilis (strain UAMH 11265 / GT02V1 / F) TaxID=1149755 RepID=A0A2J6RTD7_HYAVF|nr:hypothetical protein L207DRAFT_511569 [Hyaloscypha variabilis F]